jgi:Xaa-Pro dipeptidase
MNRSAITHLRRRSDLERERAFMQKKDLDALITMSPENVAYSIGCVIPSQFFARRRHAISIIPLDGTPVLIVADMEEGHAKNYSQIQDIRSYREFLKDPMDLLVDVLKEKELDHGRIGIELTYIPKRDFEILHKGLPKVEFVECEEIFGELYAIKNEKQIDILKRVARAAEKAIKEGFETIRPSMNEYELARIMINRFYSEGGDNICLLIVGSGERSSYPNVGPSDRVIKKGDLIRVDFLGLSEYFMSDVCRTAVVGEPTENQRRTWHKLVETKDKMLKMVKPGVKACQVYDAYLETWTSFGFKPVRFIGHGLGLSTHERPLLSDFDKIVLQKGMVFCIEPLLLIPGVEGYHLEDEILITKDGYEILTDIMETSELYEIR